MVFPFIGGELERAGCGRVAQALGAEGIKRLRPHLSACGFASTARTISCSRASADAIDRSQRLSISSSVFSPAATRQSVSRHLGGSQYLATARGTPPQRYGAARSLRCLERCLSAFTALTGRNYKQIKAGWWSSAEPTHLAYDGSWRAPLAPDRCAPARRLRQQSASCHQRSM